MMLHAAPDHPCDVREFEEYISKLPTLLTSLLSCAPHTGGFNLPRNAPRRAVYLFSDGNDTVYVGRTNYLQRRYRQHIGGRHNDAPFAFKIARHATGYLSAKGGPTRIQLQGDPAFASAFAAARKRVSTLQFRWVEVEDPNLQYLLEIYVALVLRATHNDFENH